MKYDKKSFLAGLSVGTQLKGWASTGGVSSGAETLIEDVDITNWYGGSFTVSVNGGTTCVGNVTFDADGTPTSIDINGYTMAITLGGRATTLTILEVN